MTLNLQQLLSEQEQFSELSEEPSFTLTDILEQPLDEELLEDSQIAEEDMDCFFEQEQETPQALSPNKTSKVYEFYPQRSSVLKFPNNEQSQPLEPVDIQSVQSNPGKNSQDFYQGPLQNQQERRHQRLQKLPFMPTEQINNMSFIILKNVTALFEDDKNTTAGVPTSISATGNRFLAIGTSMGNIALFEIGIRGYKLLGSSEQRKFGAVTSVSISKDNKYLVAGHESGLLALWDLYYFTLVKQEVNERNKIVQTLFCSNGSSQFVSSDSQGNTYIFTFERHLWSSLKCQRLVERNPLPFYNIRYRQIQSGNSVLVMCTCEYVLLISLLPQVKVVGKISRPDEVGPNHPPNVELGSCAVNCCNFESGRVIHYDLLLASWGKLVFVYRFLPSASGFDEIQSLYRFEMNSLVFHIQFLSPNVFVILNNHQVFETVRISVEYPEAVEKIKIGSKFVGVPERREPQILHHLVNSHEVEEEVIYQKLLKAKANKNLKIYVNTMVNCSSTMLEHKEIFFIAKNCIYRTRMHPWRGFLDQLVTEQKNFKQAMKACILFSQGKLNVFADQIQLQGKKGEKNYKYFCEVGRLFLETQLKNLKHNNLEILGNAQKSQTNIQAIREPLREVFEYLIEYLIQLHREKYLFEVIFEKVIKNLPFYGYQQLFVESLKPFIISGKLKRVPSPSAFRDILNYFSESRSREGVDHMKLVDRMVTNLQPDSLHYEQTVSVLSQNKLYKALAYVCSMNRDFISPANKLMARIQEAFQNKLQNAEKQYFSILNCYFSKLVDGLYVNDKVISTQIYQESVLRDLSNWLSFEETLLYFLKSRKDHQTTEEKFNLFLSWSKKLLLQLASLKDKSQFHEMVRHLLEALKNVQNALKSSKERTEKYQAVSPVLVRVTLNQIALYIQKGSEKAPLFYEELCFFLERAFNSAFLENDSSVREFRDMGLELREELQFIDCYFQELHSIVLTGQNLNGHGSAFEAVISQRNDWIKYFYNFKLRTIQALKEQSNNQKSKTLTNRKSEQGPPSHQLQTVLQTLNQLSHQNNIQQLCSQEARQNNAVLARYLLEVYPQSRIEKNLQSLLKLNSELTILYILKNYDLATVNAKIAKLQDGEVKYFVIRKILKALRNKSGQGHFSEEKRTFWGTQKRLFGFAKTTLARRDKEDKERQGVQENKKGEHNKFKKFLENRNAAEDIEKEREGEQDWYVQKRLSKETMLYYLECLARYKRQKRVYCQLKQHMEDYQGYIKEVLDLMEKFKLNSCIGLVQMQLQNYEKAFDYYQLVYNERFEFNLKKLALVQHCHGRFLGKIYREMLQICQLLLQKTQWMKLLEAVLEPLVEDNKFLRRRKQQVIELVQKVYETHPLHSFIQQLGDVIEQTLLQLATHLAAEEMGVLLDRYSQLMNKTFMLHCLKSTMRTFSRSIFIYQTSNDMVVSDQANEFQNIYTDHKIRGVHYTPICGFCGQLIEYEHKIKAYKCGHLYHKECLLANQGVTEKCPQCLLVEVGEKFQSQRSSAQLEDLKKQPSQQSISAPIFMSSLSSEEIKKKQTNGTKLLSSGEQDQEERQVQKINRIYQCLAFEEFLKKEEQKFDAFRHDYEQRIIKFH